MWSSPLARASVSIAVAGLGGITVGLAPPVAADPSSVCGVVTYPSSGATGYVAVVQGGLSCPAAQGLIDRYLRDQAVPHSGTTWAADFDGWRCSSPPAGTTLSQSYSSSCSHGTTDVVVVVRPSAR